MTTKSGGLGTELMPKHFGTRVAIERIFFQKDFSKKLNKMWNQSKLVWKWHNDHSKHYVTIFQQNNSIIFSTFTPIFFLKNGLFKFINLTFYNN